METARTRAEIHSADIEETMRKRARYFRTGVWPYREWSAAEFWSWQRADRDAFMERREDVRRADSRLHVRPVTFY